MTESEARSLVAGIGLVICSLIAALAWGQTALNYVYAAWMLWLTWDRANLHEHAQMRWRRTIRALAALRKRHDDELTDLRIIVMSPHLPTLVDESVDDEMNESFVHDPEPATDRIPVQPDIPTEPMALVVDPTPAVQARRDAAWDVRPSPVARDLSDEFPAPDSDEAKAKTAAWVEEQLREIRARMAQGAS